MSERTLAVGPTLGVHLEKAKVHAQLNSFYPVFAFELPHRDLAWLVFPLVQEVADVEIHALQIWTAISGKSTIRRGGGALPPRKVEILRLTEPARELAS